MDQRICELHKKYDDTISQARSKESRIQEMEEQLMLMHREIEVAKQNENESEDIHVSFMKQTKKLTAISLSVYWKTDWTKD